MIPVSFTHSNTKYSLATTAATITTATATTITIRYYVECIPVSTNSKTKYSRAGSMTTFSSFTTLGCSSCLSRTISLKAVVGMPE